MKSMTRRVAEFCRRPNGAICSEIEEQFDISRDEARSIMRSIRVGGMYECTETREKNKIRVRVSRIAEKTGRQRVAVIAKNIITGEEHKFDSLADADAIGGFYQQSIRRCLSGEKSSYAGYYWKRA